MSVANPAAQLAPGRVDPDTDWLLVLVLGTTATGAAPIFVRLTDVGPLASGFWRLALALPGFWLWLRLSGSPERGRWRPAVLVPLVLAGLCYGCDLAFWNRSILLTSATNATLLANLAPVFVVLAAWLLFGERPQVRLVGGLALALVGAALLVGDGFALASEQASGDLFALVAAVFYAGYLLALGRARATVDAARAMLASGAVAALVLLAAASARGETLLPAGMAGWWPLVGLALLCHVGGQGLIAVALQRLPLGSASAGTLAQPAAAALLAWLVFGETLGPLQLVGGAVLLAGLVLVSRARVARPTQAPCAEAAAPSAAVRPQRP